MSNQVYANNMEVSCKKAAGKSICAFPDVCFTPPQTPPTPMGVPIPYPNTGMASDSSDGTSTVKISGQEVMLKNKSCFKQSVGNEAGAAPKKGLITSKNKGKVYFTAWSMDVKFEGENVVRMLDMTTHNHGSMPANSPPWVYTDTVGMTVGGVEDPCESTRDKAKEKCQKHFDKNVYKGGKRSGEVNVTGVNRDICNDDECKKAMECVMAPYEYGCCKEEGDPPPGEDAKKKQPHHLVEVHCFTKINQRGTGDDEVMSEFTGYDAGKAPCICASGPREDKEHGACHAIQRQFEAAYNSRIDAPQTPMSSGVSNWTYAQAREAGVTAQLLVFPQCDHRCTEAQLDNYHKTPKPNGPGVSDGTPVRSDVIQPGGVGELTSRQHGQLSSRILISMIPKGL